MLIILIGLGLLLSLFNSAQAALVVLYDGNGLPATQPWLVYASNNGAATSESSVLGGVQFQSDLASSAGYSNRTPFGLLKNPAFPQLDRNLGYELTFTLAMPNETHTSDDRAGFSLTLLGNDSLGVELGFWTDQVWAQSGSQFLHAETALLDTTQRREYRLQIMNNSYSLFTGNNLLLNNVLRDFRPSGLLPYQLPNFLFMGDNTTRGAATAILGPVSLQTDLTAVPEPSSLTFVAIAVGCLLRRRSLRQKQDA